MTRRFVAPHRVSVDAAYPRLVTTGRLLAVRAVRSLALTSTSVGAGLVAHWHAGGATPHPLVLLVVLGLLALPVTRLSARRVSPLAAAAVLGAGQAAIHLAGMATGPAITASGHMAHGGHIHLASEGTAADGSGLPMLAAHAAVTLVLALAWSRGEQILFAVTRRLALPALAAWSVPAAVRVRPTTAAPVRDAARRWHPSRGPPLPVS